MNQYYGGENVVICPNCGAQNAANEAACRNCGYAFNPQQPQYQEQYQQPQYQDQYQQPQYQNGQYPQYQNGQYPQYQDGQYPQYQDQYHQPYAPEGDLVDPMDVQQNKVMAVLSYFGIFVLIPLLAAKNSRFARFHANQGLILLLAGFLGGIVGGVISAIIPELGSVITSLISLAVFVLEIMGIVNAAKGEAKELPLVGQFRLLK